MASDCLVEGATHGPDRSGRLELKQGTGPLPRGAGRTSSARPARSSMTTGLPPAGGWRSNDYRDRSMGLTAKPRLHVRTALGAGPFAGYRNRDVSARGRKLVREAGTLYVTASFVIAAIEGGC